MYFITLRVYHSINLRLFKKFIDSSIAQVTIRGSDIENAERFLDSLRIYCLSDAPDLYNHDN